MVAQLSRLAVTHPTSDDHNVARKPTPPIGENMQVRTRDAQEGEEEVASHGDTNTCERQCSLSQLGGRRHFRPHGIIDRHHCVMAMLLMEKRRVIVRVGTHTIGFLTDSWHAPQTNDGI